MPAVWSRVSVHVQIAPGRRGQWKNEAVHHEELGLPALLAVVPAFEHRYLDLRYVKRLCVDRRPACPAWPVLQPDRDPGIGWARKAIWSLELTAGRNITALPNTSLFADRVVDGRRPSLVIALHLEDPRRIRSAAERDKLASTRHPPVTWPASVSGVSGEPRRPRIATFEKQHKRRRHSLLEQFSAELIIFSSYPNTTRNFQFGQSFILLAKTFSSVKSIFTKRKKWLLLEKSSHRWLVEMHVLRRRSCQSRSVQLADRRCLRPRERWPVCQRWTWAVQSTHHSREVFRHQHWAKLLAQDPCHFVDGQPLPLRPRLPLSVFTTATRSRRRPRRSSGGVNRGKVRSPVQHRWSPSELDVSVLRWVFPRLRRDLPSTRWLTPSLETLVISKICREHTSHWEILQFSYAWYLFSTSLRLLWKFSLSASKQFQNEQHEKFQSLRPFLYDWIWRELCEAAQCSWGKNWLFLDVEACRGGLLRRSKTFSVRCSRF